MQFLKRLTPMVDAKQNPAANTIYVDRDTEAIKVGTGASGNSERTLMDSSGVYTGQILAGDGTSALPTYTFLNDPNTGRYWVSAGIMRDVIDGATYLTIGSSAVNAAVQLLSASSIAVPAGGSTSCRLVIGSTSGFGVYVGSGLPTVTAAQGSLYLRSDGSSTSTRAYINTDGATTWTAITTAT